MSKPLPKIKTLTYQATLPVSGEKVSYRPYNVSDERLLIAAAAAKDTDKEFYVNNTLSVVKQSVVSDIDVTKLPSIDVEYLLMHQRAISAGELVELQYKGKPVSFNIKDVKPVNPRSKESYTIMIDDNLGIKMKELNFEERIRAAVSIDASDNTSEKLAAKVFFKLVLASVESIFNEEDVWVIGTDISAEDAENFINDIPSTQSKSIYDFVNNPPYLTVDIIVDGEVVSLTSKDTDFLG